ncbi:hypothetical protein ABG79_02032 [Caloramator mitchellensis]|uniref:Uncharacterized protein n=1 Tax=Caloramator mitchellensis TaxID=908809 RepID=A0A0R3K1N0_CALMK|nr:DUF948 domain-containing protein [Caloramator mitchellensis]KRQ86191.1 hypothetical protein ABG79_02032 [Caloramator mitchellensis]
MTLTITPQGVMYFFLSISLVLITVYLVKTLISLNKLLNNVNQVIEENKSNIDESLANVNAITSSAKGKMDFIDKFIKSDETATSKDEVDIFSTISMIITLINELKELLPKRKKHR